MPKLKTYRKMSASRLKRIQERQVEEIASSIVRRAYPIFVKGNFVEPSQLDVLSEDIKDLLLEEITSEQFFKSASNTTEFTTDDVVVKKVEDALASSD